MHFSREGGGQPLLLVHGLGSEGRSWSPVLPGLRAHRDVITPDLPGFGRTPPLPGEVTISAIADRLEVFIDEHGLHEADLVGSSLGGRLVLELARRGHDGAVVALDPGGFWTPGQVKVFKTSMFVSMKLVRLLQPALPTLLGNRVGRTALLAQLSAKPWALPEDLVLAELRRFATAPGFDATLRALVGGPPQQGMPGGTAEKPITIGWGRHDRLTPPSQAKTALERFPDAGIHWFAGCGHFPHWDAPSETIRLILEKTG